MYGSKQLESEGVARGQGFRSGSINFVEGRSLCVCCVWVGAQSLRSDTHF